MKKYSNVLKVTSVALLFVTAAFVTSCRKDADPFSGEVNQTINNEATQDSQQDEIDDIATTQLNASDPAGRIATGEDGRVSCALITVTLGAEKGSGTVVIDFDHKANGDSNPDGCTDAKGNVRKGKITITWTGGRWFKVGAVITITCSDYSINGVVINGTRTLTNITTNVLFPTWTIVADHNAKWPNGNTATRTVHKTRQWDIAGGKIIVTQTPGADSAAAGTNRHGTSYSVQITEALTFDIACSLSNKVYLPVSGTKVVTFDNKVVTIDFGSGTCDNTFTITFNAKTHTITAKNDDSAD